MNTLDSILNALGERAKTLPCSGLILEQLAQTLLNMHKVEAVFPGQQPEGAKEPYKFVTCISLNNEVIHGLPDARQFEEGDVVSIDLGIKEDGLIFDGATTVIVGKGAAMARKLVAATREALDAGIAAAKVGSTNFSITEAIEAVAKKYELLVVNGYGGHGVGEKLHQDPFIANRAADLKGEPVKLEAGMRLAIEPMFCTTRSETFIAPNGWTVKVPSGRAAHFERTITIA